MPYNGCSSEKGYADECDLGHQYMPVELINPKSTLSGNKPEMRDVVNWYFKLENCGGLLREWLSSLEKNPASRGFMLKAIQEFLEPPVIYMKKEYLASLDALKDKLPSFTVKEEENKPSAVLVFKTLADRESPPRC